MSKAFLYAINQNRDGRLKKWLDDFKGEPQIAWYPSAGTDFRDLLYLGSAFAKLSPAPPYLEEPPPPDFFLHTDYFPWSGSTFMNSPVLYHDAHTTIIAREFEELGRMDLPLDPKILHFPKGSVATGRVVFLEIEARSDALGTFHYPLLYAFVENAAFCAQKAIPLQARFSHIVHVRYGGGCGGGGNSTGIWLLNVLERLGCSLYITDDHGGIQSGDERVYQRWLNEINRNRRPCHLSKVRTIASHRWSGHGDVSWYLTSL